MKILILGATGRTGKFLVEYALEKDFEVICLVRDPRKIKPRKGLTILQGNPIHKNDLENALDGCQAVVSALNISRNSDFPWAKLRTPRTYLSDVMQNVINLSKSTAVEHIVICSAWGVLETRKEIPFWFRWMIDYSNIGVAYKDHERQEKVLENSKLHWTVIRPVGLINSKTHQKVKESYVNSPKPSLLISRRSVAKYMIECLGNSGLFSKKVVISKA